MATTASLQAVPELNPTLEDVSSTCSTMTSVPSTYPTTSSSESHTCPYKDCHKSFSKKYNLKAHLRLHTGEQPFQCDRPDCRKKFKWRSSLSSHTVWHTRKDNANATAPPDVPMHTNKRDASVTKSEASVTKASKASPLKSKQKDATVVKGARKPPVASSAPASAETSSASPANKKKRPRIDVPRQQSCKSTVTTASQGGEERGREALATRPPCTVSESVCGSNQVETLAGGEDDAPEIKRRRLDDGKFVVELYNCATTAESAPKLKGVAEDTSSPGSPVTSDGGHTEPVLDLDIFPCDVLPPLLGGGEDGLAFEGGEVDAVLSGSNDIDLFGLASPSCGALHGLDTRFGSFDLDSLQNF